MVQIFFIISILAQLHPVALLKTAESSIDKCALYSDDFWIVYQTHFLLVNFLNFKVLQTEDYRFEVNQFTETVIQILNSYDYFITTTIQENFLDKNIKSFNHSHTPRDNVPRAVVNNSDPIGEEELFRIKMFTSDSINGHVIIVWDVNTLHKFLDEDYQIVVPEARATYALVFVISSTESCDIIKNELNSILRRFWINYNVVNVIAQTPCICDNNQVYVYRPFTKMDDSWGLMENYNFEEVVNDFRVITNSLSDFNQFPLGVSLFVNEPTAIRELPKLLRTNPIYRNLNSSGGFAGLDGLILGTLAEYLNFDTELVENMDEDPVGTALSNGTITGTLRDVINRRSVFGANSRFLADYSTSDIEFTIAYTGDQICVVVPKAHKIPNWKTLFYCFDVLSWFLIVVTCIASVIFWYFTGPSRLFIKASWEMYSYLMGIPIKIVPSISQIFFLVSCMMFNIIILGVVQGSFFTGFTMTTYYDDINTLKEVDESEMPIAADIWYFIQDDSELIRRLKKKSVEVADNIFDLVAYQRNIVAFETKLYSDLLIKSKYVDEAGLPLLHIVDECVTTFLTANIVPKGSAFLTVFNNVIMRLHESGLTSKWYDDVVDSMIAEKMISLSKSQKDVKSFSLYDVQSAFYLIVLGDFCSVIVFFGELLLKRSWWNL
ncbi:hypothetical protein BDFB_004727 [Asbolus verrucosus]|uniref:Lig chan domain containing protein n=1 Tax=Asbolus verrucosus TaxID=1661398 RepID=A0A482VY71_ASBVE|nr:hypothetical protein BDFB_004727 [Asbolus verrucosus]